MPRRVSSLLVLLAASALSGCIQCGPQPEAVPTAKASPQLTAGAGHMGSDHFQLDVQLGHPTEQRAASGATQRLEGNAGVKP